ncbi:MAG: lipopolysaccharide biosynthesis protein [Acidipila sp.]|nr:lipopolysaccharide biosynthesis protein [Acidipila sp.]
MNQPAGSIADLSLSSVEILETPSLRRNFVWTMAGNVVYAACQWGMLVAIAKLGTAVMVGQFVLGLAVSAPVFMFTNLQLRAVEATDAKRKYRFGHYLGLRLLGSGIALAVIAGMIAFSGYRRETALVVLAVALAKAAESVSDVLYGLWQNRERLDKISIAMSCRGMGALAAVALTLFFTRDIMMAVLAMAAVWLGFLLTYERGVARRMLVASEPREFLRAEWDVSRLRALAWLALPLGVVALVGSLNANVPRYFVQHYLGEAKLGYFAALGYVVVAGSTLINALGQSASPRLARYYHSDRPAFTRLLLKMTALAVGLGALGELVALLFSRPVLTLLYRPEYAEYADTFVWLMAAGVVNFVVSMLGYGITAAHFFRVQVPLYTAACLAIAVACWWFVPREQLTGAAYAVLIGGVVSCVGSAGILVRVVRTPAMEHAERQPDENP